jgi:hypothetical protein
MHYEWSNYPVNWHLQFQDKDGNKSIILKAIMDQSFLIWHTFFGLPNGNNDISVLDQSLLIHNLLA